MQFKATCSKANQRFVLIINSASLESAKEELHKQGYSIMQIDEYLWDTGSDEDFFYFDAYNQNGELQTGKIQSNDIFKAYVKLVEEMEYNVKYIYPMEDISEDEKMRVTAKVKSGYELSKKVNTEDARIIDEKRRAALKAKGENLSENLSSEVKNELARYEKVIDTINEQIEKLILEHGNVIASEKQTRLRDLVQSLNQLKTSTNVARIAMVAEAALKKIGEIQIEVIVRKHIVEKEKYLETTNKLLKDIGSKEHIEAVHKEDAMEAIQRLTNQFFEKKEDPNKKNIDTHSFVYFKNLRELNVYKKKLVSTELEILKDYFFFRFDHAKRLMLKRRLLLQNIQIIENRITNQTISYSKISKWLQYYVDIFLGFFRMLGEIALYGVFLLTLVYILSETIHTGYVFQGNVIKIIIFLAFFWLLSRGMKEISFFLLAWFFLFFVMYFYSVNF